MLGDALLVARYLRHLDRLVALGRARGGPDARGMAHEFPALARFYLARVQPTSGAIFRDDVRLGPGARVPQAPRRGQARDHHLRRDARLLPADGHGAGGGAGAGAGRRCSTTGACSAATRRASGCPSAATCPGHERFLREAGIRFSFLEAHGLTDAHPRPTHGVRAPDPVARRHRLLRARPRVVAAGVERRGGLSRATPTTASSTRTSAGSCPTSYLGDVAARRAAQERRHQVLPRHRQGRAWPTSSPTSASGRMERAADHAGHFLEERQQAGQRAGARGDGPAAAGGEPLRRRAVRPLVVRGAGLPELPVPQAALRPGRGQRDHAVRVPGRATPSSRSRSRRMCTWGAKGYAEVWLNPGNDWIYRAPRRGRRAHGRAGAPVRAAVGPGTPRAQPGRARAAARPGVRLGVHHEDRTRWSSTRRSARATTSRASRTSTACCREGGLEEPILREFEERDNHVPRPGLPRVSLTAPACAAHACARRRSRDPGTRDGRGRARGGRAATSRPCRPGAAGPSRRADRAARGAAVLGPGGGARLRPARRPAGDDGRAGGAVAPHGVPGCGRVRGGRFRDAAGRRAVVDADLAEALRRRRPQVVHADARPHRDEHSLEMQLPFVQRLVPDAAHRARS